MIIVSKRFRKAIYAKLIAEQRNVICHMRSHSITCHRTQVNASYPP